MLDTLRKVIVSLLTSPEPVEPPPARRQDTAVVLIAAAAVGAWIFSFHLRRFFGLGTSSDLYVYVQLATSWLDGRFLQDNYFGNYLSVHTYFLCPLLAIFAYPFGAPGLLFALGLAAAFSVVALVKILRLFDVPRQVATAYAVIATVMPLSLQVYQVDRYGFQIELLVPSLVLWLAYFLLQRKWTGSLVLGAALLALKEDSALIIVPVAVIVMGEDFFRSLASGAPRNWRKMWNRPALVLGLLSVLIMPALLYLVKSQPAQVYSNMGSFAKVNSVDRSSISGMDSLVGYVVTNLPVWLRSATVAKWLLTVLAGTWGLIVLRPHLLLVGVLTTLTAWLVQGDIMWAPRFAPALAFIQLTGCLAFVSVCRLVRDRSRQGSKGAWILAAVGGVALSLGLLKQYRLAPKSSEVYRLAPALAISPDDRRKADELFEIYRREGRPKEPVIASEYLFRYIHDRDFYWYSRLRDRPKPAWILWDQQATPLSVLLVHLKTDVFRDLSHYELVGQAERFLLYRAWDGRKGPPGPEPTVVNGESHGSIRLKVQLAPGRAGTSEPILSLGPAGRGELLFVHYLGERQLVLGLDSVGLSVQLGEPVDYEPGREYELEFFSGSLLPAAGTSPAGAPTAVERLGYQNFVSLKWAGREILNTLAPPHALGPGEIYAGYNFVRSGSAVANFSGKITGVRRGGYPPLTGEGAQAFGAVHVQVQLPDTAVGLAEPLVVVGVPGDATLGYVRLLAEGKIKVGADFWSVDAYESAPLPVDRAQPAEIIYSFPVFYPPVGDPRWGNVPGAMQEKLRTWLRISVNGEVVVDRKVVARIPRQPTVAYGKNPAGGSVVTQEFTGKVLQVSREPLGPP